MATRAARRPRWQDTCDVPYWFAPIPSRRARRIQSREDARATVRAARISRALAIAVLLALSAALGVLLVGCGSGSSSTIIQGQGQQVNLTPVPASGWTTYTNTTYGYTIQYPANWFTSGTSASAEDIEIYNFDPSQLDSTDNIPPPPFDKYSLDAFANPSHLTMSDYYTQYRASDPSSPPADSQTQHAATVAGRPALEVIQQTVQWPGGKIAYPSVTYFVPDGDNVLILNELYSPGGQPSAVLAHMVSSLKFGK